jgi:hypothetical protein
MLGDSLFDDGHASPKALYHSIRQEKGIRLDDGWTEKLPLDAMQDHRQP